MRTGGEDVFSFYIPTRIIHGAGSSTKTGQEFRSLGATKALVVTDKGVNSAGLLEQVLKSIRAEGFPYVVFDKVQEDPGEETVQEGARISVDEKCDGIVVVGGGSPMCAARGMAILATNGGKIGDYAGFNKASKTPLPVVAIPTTAGSGCEVSQFIILKNEERHCKMVLGSPSYFPKVAILDPLLLRTVPFWQAAAAGIDALAHGIEAYLTTLVTPITDALALGAINLIFPNLRAACFTDDLEAKEACLIGSTMANVACGNALLGLAHMMTVPVEGMSKIPHGIDLGILLPHVMEFNLPASHERFAALAKCMGEFRPGFTREALAASAISAVKKLLLDLGFPRSYAEFNLDKKEIPHMAEIIAAGVYEISGTSRTYNLLSPVPSVNIRKAVMGDVISLYEKAFEGWIM